MYVVELHSGCWLAEGDGDPCRTLVIENAQQFEKESLASAALKKAKSDYSFRKFENSRVVPYKIEKITKVSQATKDAIKAKGYFKDKSNLNEVVLD